MVCVSGPLDFRIVKSLLFSSYVYHHRWLDIAEDDRVTERDIVLSNVVEKQERKLPKGNYKQVRYRPAVKVIDIFLTLNSHIGLNFAIFKKEIKNFHISF